MIKNLAFFILVLGYVFFLPNLIWAQEISGENKLPQHEIKNLTLVKDQNTTLLCKENQELRFEILTNIETINAKVPIKSCKLTLNANAALNKVVIEVLPKKAYMLDANGEKDFFWTAYVQRFFKAEKDKFLRIQANKSLDFSLQTTNTDLPYSFAAYIDPEHGGDYHEIRYGIFKSDKGGYLLKIMHDTSISKLGFLLPSHPLVKSAGDIVINTSIEMF